MIKSLKNQIFFVLVVLISILLVEILLSYSVQSSLLINQNTINQSYVQVGLARELERDVIDLQRNLLIFKETASETSVSRFHELMISLNQRLDRFKAAARDSDSKATQIDIIKRMRAHLNNYNDNFSSVIEGRSQRNKIIKNQIQPVFLNLEKITNNSNSDKQLIIYKIKYHIALSKSLINQYLNFPDYELVNQFKTEISSTHSLLSSITWNNNDPNLLLKSLKKDFFKLTQVTRGYVFLVNVVMAGSANEFLYLTRRLTEIVTKDQKEMSILIKSHSKSSQFTANIVSILSILIALLAGWFLSNRVILPIRKITDVFGALSKDKSISNIPGINRTDEIGDLAKAADVFHSKNKQTSELLSSTQKMNHQQEKLNIELDKQKQKAEQAVKSKSMFLANMSHEIRTPMNGIIGLIDLTLKNNPTKEQRKYLEKAAFSGQILKNVINDILDFSKIEAGKMDIESIRFSVDTIINNIISTISISLKEKALNFRITTSLNLPEKLNGDPLRISQILLNICNNAIKFTEQGMVHVHFNFEETNNKQFLHIDIKDTGIGLTQQEIDNIFHSFTQADGSTSRKYGGTGLGLTIVRQLTELMGGEVSVMSEKDHGSCFKVSIKVQSASEEKAIKAIQKDNLALSYLSLEPSSLLEDSLFSSLNVQAKKIQWQDLDSNLLDDDADHTVIIDVSTMDDVNNKKDFINSLQKKDISFAFITDIQPQNLSKQLAEDWNIPVLQHPFSPSHCNDFFAKLFRTNQSSSGTESITSENEIHFKGHVLLVEDNHVNQLVAGQMLKNFGLTCDIAENGQVAVDMISNSNAYDLVLMDIQMPIMDGYEATQYLRNNDYTDLIICGLSANAMKQDLERAEGVGMNDYITKPIATDDMAAILNKYLDKATA